jgi:hypothetical protein
VDRPSLFHGAGLETGMASPAAGKKGKAGDDAFPSAVLFRRITFFRLDPLIHY